MNKIVLYDGRIQPLAEAPWMQKEPLYCDDSVLGITDLIIEGKPHRIISIDFTGNINFSVKPTILDSKVEIYVSSHGNLCRREFTRNGIQHTIFRKWKPKVTESERMEWRGKIFRCDVDVKEILKVTEPIGDWVLHQWIGQTTEVAK